VSVVITPETPVRYLKGVGSYYGDFFEKKKILTCGNLLLFFPCRYEDRSTIVSIREGLHRTNADPDAVVTVIGLCTEVSSFEWRGRTIKKVTFTDGERTAVLSAFNPAHGRFKPGLHYMLSCRFKEAYQEIQIQLRDFDYFDQESIDSLNVGRVVPVYHSTDGLPQKKIRETVNLIFSEINPGTYSWNIPSALTGLYKFPEKFQCIYQMHFPADCAALERARNALVYEELFEYIAEKIHTSNEYRKGKEGARYPTHELTDLFRSKLPITLTCGQEKAVAEICADMRKDKAMMRLLQGDVGSGKTITALITMILCVENGYQCACMVPTEILCRQHYLLFTHMLSPFGIRTVMLSGSLKETEKKKALEQIRGKEADITVGTHALIQDDVEFFNLKYAVIDEQHRFGVAQREALRKKGIKPDMLYMSATPIPQSLFNVFWGDLDVSALTETPAFRKPVHTKMLTQANRAHAYRFLRDRIGREEQAYVVFPVIEESEKTDMRSLKKEYNFLKDTAFRDIPGALMHGGLHDCEKHAVMDQFNCGSIKVLCATTVMEVGLDNPNATVVIIESAERFGLSQLHQIRGRVGRGKKQGYCYVITGEKISQTAVERLRFFCTCTDGFKIAEADLQQRGPGDFIGTRQAGLPEFKLADIRRDETIIGNVRRDVLEITG